MADSVTDHKALQVAFVFQEEGLSVDWQLNQDSSIAKSTRLEIWRSEVRILVQVQIFLLKSDKTLLS